jgi:hypothetical protein
VNRLVKLLLKLGFIVAAPLCAQTTQTYTGVIKDLTQQVVTSGQVTFTLALPNTSTIPGTGTFVPTTTLCNINVDGTLSGYVGGVVSGSSVVPTLPTGPINYGGVPGPAGPTGPQGPIGAPTSGVNLTPSGAQTVVQPGTTPLNVNNLLTSNNPFKCVESYLSADVTHGGTDYGAAISAAVQASSLTSTTELKVCIPGDHPVYTTALFDRPIAFHQDGQSRLIPQATMGSTPIKITGATATAGSMNLTVSSIAGVTVNMAVGGIGIPYGAFVTAVSGTTVTISLPANLQFYGIATSGSNQITGVSSVSGLGVGQTLNGVNTWPFVSGTTTISSINYTTNTVTASSNATSGSPIPNTFVVGGTWSTNLTFVKTTPVLSFIYNQNALHDNFGMMYGASLHGVWIEDVSGVPAGLIPTTTPGYFGVTGVQIVGYDQFASYDLHIENIQGSALILGGTASEAFDNGFFSPVREASFPGTQIRNSGDAQTGQAALAIMTSREGNQSAADENNEISFSASRIVYSNGTAVNIGTYNTAHTGNFGPGGIHFSDDFQIEGWAVNADIAAQSDTILIQRGGDIHFQHGAIALAGQGKAVIRADTVFLLSLDDVSMNNTGVISPYTVGVINGSTTVTYISGGGRQGAFNTTQTWDGMGVSLNGTSVWLAPISPVSSSGATLTLAVPWTGATGTFTMNAGYGGVMVESSSSIGHISFRQAQFPVLDSVSLGLLGNPVYTNLFKVGAAFYSNTTFTQDDLNRGYFSQGPTQYGSYGSTVDTSKQGTFQTWNLAGQGESDYVNVLTGGTVAQCFYNVALNAAVGSPSVCFSPTGIFNTPALQIATGAGVSVGAGIGTAGVVTITLPVAEPDTAYKVVGCTIDTPSTNAVLGNTQAKSTTSFQIQEINMEVSTALTGGTISCLVARN